MVDIRIYHMITKNIKLRIQEYFFRNPTSKLRVRQIERETNSPLPSVIRYVKELNTENILKREEIANIMTFSANRSSEEFLLEKKLYNYRTLTKLKEYLIEQLDNPIIIVFGSYAKGEDIEKSDIDIYIETPSKKEISLAKFEEPLQRNIQLFRQKSIKEIKNKELRNNIINGIILHGYLEIF